MNISKNHVFWALNYYHFVNDGIVFLIPILVAIFDQKLDLEYTQTTFLFTIHIIFIVITQIFVGRLVDLNHESLSYIIGSIFTTVSTILLLFPRDYWSLLILIIFNGIGLGFIHSLLYVNGAKLFPIDRERKMAIQGAMGDLGKMIAVFSIIILNFINPDLWPVALIIWGILAFGIIIFGIIVMPRFSFSNLNKSADLQLNSSAPLRANNVKSWISKGLIILILILIVYNGSYDLVVKQITIFFQDQRTGASRSNAILLYGILVGCGTIGAYISGPLKLRWGLKKYVTIMYGTLAVILFIFISVGPDLFISDAIFCGLLGFFILSLYIPIQSELSFFMHSSQMGIGYAILFGFGWGGGVLWLAIAGPIADYFESAYVFLIMGFILCCLTIILVQFAPKRKMETH